jgi:hypothetical protein
MTFQVLRGLCGKRIHPDEYAPSVHDVDFSRLWAGGIRVLLFDLDNTLCFWRENPDERSLGLLRELLASGFRIAVLSNGQLGEREKTLEALLGLGIPVIWPARKPMSHGFRRALRLLSARPKETAVIGDQLFTDVWGAKRLGLYAVRVSPLDPREHPLTKILRKLERLFERKR